jgi:hypothetical protein
MSEMATNMRLVGRPGLGKPPLMPCLMDTYVLIDALTGNASAAVLARIDPSEDLRLQFKAIDQLQCATHVAL